MTTENQDPQKPTEDQPPPKQYAGQSSREPGERGVGERKPKIPNQVESSEGDDENSTAAEQNADYSHSSIPRTDDDLVTGPGQGGGIQRKGPSRVAKQAANVLPALGSTAAPARAAVLPHILIEIAEAKRRASLAMLASA